MGTQAPGSSTGVQRLFSRIKEGGDFFSRKDYGVKRFYFGKRVQRL